MKVSLKNGQNVIRRFVKTLPERPGVYRMMDHNHEELYIGKAKSLKKRVQSYIRVNSLPHRLKHMVALTVKMEFVITESEAEALLLEANMIRSLKPRFNILLKDDKSFPYIHLSGNHDYPMVRKHRGAKRQSGKYFGPFADVRSVTKTIDILQRVFMLRNCTDHVFANRSRPCLQYHIKRCTAPCVGFVSKAEYSDQVYEAKQFLNGNSKQVQKSFTKKMQAASDKMDFEKAAFYRDRVKALNAIHAHQNINFNGVDNADVMVIAEKDGRSCVQVFFFRSGQNYGQRTYFPRHDVSEEASDILTNVMAQFYTDKIPAPYIYINEKITNHDVIRQALSERIMSDSNSKHTMITISKPERGEKKRMVDFCVQNARAALDRHIAQKMSEVKVLEQIADLLNIEKTPKRIEVYDNSHTSGTNMVGAMIVAGEDGFKKSAYRIFNIRTADASDDYGMMREVMRRRFKHIHDLDKRGELPDLVLIDGGAGQLSSVAEVFEDMGITDIPYVAIAKGADRNAGREQIFIPDKPAFQLPINHPVLHYLQTIRDEAHRFAIGAHRRRRNNASVKSELDSIPNVGPARKRALLQHFGSVKAIEAASMQDIQAVNGISKHTARIIYDFFHGD